MVMEPELEERVLRANSMDSPLPRVAAASVRPPYARSPATSRECCAMARTMTAMGGLMDTNACGGCGEVTVETCDEVDNDCDGRTDESWVR